MFTLYIEVAWLLTPEAARPKARTVAVRSNERSEGSDPARGCVCVCVSVSSFCIILC